MSTAVKRAAIFSPRVPVRRLLSSMSMPAWAKVAGIRSEKHLSVSDASAPVRVWSKMLWISSTRTRPVRALVQTPTTASVRSVVLELRRTGKPRNQANSAAIMRGVAVDLPEPALGGDARVAPSHRPAFGGVVGAVVDPDAVGVDGPPGRGQEFDVVLAAERDRDVAAGLDQDGVLLVGGEQASWVVGITQPLVRPVLPLRDDPLIEQVLEFGQ